MVCCLQPPTPAVLGVLKMLLNKGANTSATDSGGRNVLGVAVAANNAPVVRILLCHDSADFDLNHVDDDGLAPLHLAVQVGNASIVRMLVTVIARHGINVNRRDRNGMTPLMLACKKGRPDIVLLLAKIGKASFSMRDDVWFRSAEEWLRTSELAVIRPDILETTIATIKTPLNAKRIHMTTKKVSVDRNEATEKVASVMKIDNSYFEPNMGVLLSTTGNVHVRRPFPKHHLDNIPALPSSRPASMITLSPLNTGLDVENGTIRRRNVHVRFCGASRATLATSGAGGLHGQKVQRLSAGPVLTKQKVQRLSAGPVLTKQMEEAELKVNGAQNKSFRIAFSSLFSMYSKQCSPSYCKSADQGAAPNRTSVGESQRHGRQSGSTPGFRGNDRNQGKLSSRKLDNIMELMMGRKKKSGVLGILTGKSQQAAGSGSGSGSGSTSFKWGKFSIGGGRATRSDSVLETMRERNVPGDHQCRSTSVDAPNRGPD